MNYGGLASTNIHIALKNITKREGVITRPVYPGNLDRAAFADSLSRHYKSA
ncbi:hypothetical protein D3C85_1381060 [compost metagenome]